MSGPNREMTLREFIEGKLPRSHLARDQFHALVDWADEISRGILECDGTENCDHCFGKQIVEEINSKWQTKNFANSVQ